MIALDNMVLALAIRGAGPESDRARAYLGRLEDEGTPMAIPAPALAEFLVGVPAAQHLRVLSVMRHRFIILDLDALAAARAAEVMAANLARVRAEHGAGQPGARQALKTDALILGVCLARGVRKIATDDAGMRAMAKGFPELDIVTMPPAPTQSSLPFNAAPEDADESPPPPPLLDEPGAPPPPRRPA